jgi:hypothetical protein
MAARARRHARDWSPEEVAALMSPDPSIESLLERPELPPVRTVEMPPWLMQPPAWVKGQGLERWTREPGTSDFPPPALQLPRRLTVVYRDEPRVYFSELDPSASEQVSDVIGQFTFDPQLGGALVVYGGGRGPDPLDRELGCLGRWSPWVVSIELAGDDADRRLVVVESDPDRTTRVVPLDEREPASLYVEVVKPDVAEPWNLVTDTSAFLLSKVVSLELTDVAEG